MRHSQAAMRVIDEGTLTVTFGSPMHIDGNRRPLCGSYEVFGPDPLPDGGYSVEVICQCPDMVIARFVHEPPFVYEGKRATGVRAGTSSRG